MQPEEQDPRRMVGWHVVETGRRQAWPFLNLADPQSGRELRLYIDATFDVQPDFVQVQQHDNEVYAALDALAGLTVTGASALSGGLRLDFDSQALLVEGMGNELTSHSPWWVGGSSMLLGSSSEPPHERASP